MEKRALKNVNNCLYNNHRHLKIIDCLRSALFASLVLKTVASEKEEKKPILSCASSGHINKLKQSIFAPSISMIPTFTLT